MWLVLGLQRQDAGAGQHQGPALHPRRGDQVTVQLRGRDPGCGSPPRGRGQDRVSLPSKVISHQRWIACNGMYVDNVEL